MKERLRGHFQEAHAVLERVLADETLLNRLHEAADVMACSLRDGNKIISCGNGGSMSDAMHFAEELTGRFREDRPSYAALAISDPAYLTCTGNDYGYDAVFARFVAGVGRPGDVLLAISTSGNSANVVRAAQQAREQGLTVVGLTGKDGGELAGLCHLELRVPHDGYADRIQEIHIKFIHALIDGVEQMV